MVKPLHLTFVARENMPTIFLESKWQLETELDRMISVVLCCYMELLGLTSCPFLREKKLECTEPSSFRLLITLWTTSNFFYNNAYNEKKPADLLYNRLYKMYPLQNVLKTGCSIKVSLSLNVFQACVYYAEAAFSDKRFRHHTLWLSWQHSR